MLKLPRVRIRFSPFLNQVYEELFWTRARRPSAAYPLPKEIDCKTVQYRRRWRTEGQLLLAGMCDILDLHFRAGLIHIHIVGFARSISDPVVIDSSHEPDVFVDVLTHELLHCLFTGHVEIGSISCITQKIFPTEWAITKNHILLFAVHEHLYRNVLKDESRLERDIAASEHLPAGYLRAWNIVQERGYDHLIQDFKGDSDWPK